MKHRHVIFIAGGKLYSAIVPAYIRFDSAASYRTPFELDFFVYELLGGGGGVYDQAPYGPFESARNALGFTAKTRQDPFAIQYPSAHTLRRDGLEQLAGVPLSDFEFQPETIVGGEPHKRDFPIDFPPESHFVNEERFSVLRGNFPYMHGRDGDGVYYEFPVLPLNGMESFSRTPFNTNTSTVTVDFVGEGAGSATVPISPDKIPPVALNEPTIDTRATDPDTGNVGTYPLANVATSAYSIPIKRLYEDGTIRNTSRTLPGFRHLLTPGPTSTTGTYSPGSDDDGSARQSGNGSVGGVYTLPTGQNPTGNKVAGGGMDGCYLQDILFKLNTMGNNFSFGYGLKPLTPEISAFLAGTRVALTFRYNDGFMNFRDYVDYVFFDTPFNYRRAQSYNTGFNSNYLDADFTYGTILPSATSSILDIIRGVFYERFVVGGDHWPPSNPSQASNLWVGLNVPISISRIIREIFYDAASTSATLAILNAQANCEGVSTPPPQTEDVTLEPSFEIGTFTQRVGDVRSVVHLPRIRINRFVGGAPVRTFAARDLAAYGLDYVDVGDDDIFQGAEITSVSSFESICYDDNGVSVDKVTQDVVDEWQRENIIYEGIAGTLYAPQSIRSSTINGVTIPSGNDYHCVDWFVAEGVTYTVGTWSNRVLVSVDGIQAWSGLIDEFLPPDLFARVNGATSWQHYRFLLENHPTPTGVLEFAFHEPLVQLGTVDVNGDNVELPETEREDTWQRVLIGLRPALEGDTRVLNDAGDECPVVATILPTFDFRSFDNYLHNNQLRPWMITDTTSYTYPEDIFNVTTSTLVAINQAKLVHEVNGGFWINNVNPAQTGELEITFFYESFDQNGYRVYLRDVFVFYEGDGTGLNINDYTRHDVDLYGYEPSNTAVKLAVFTINSVDEFSPQSFIVVDAPNSSVVGIAALEDYWEIPS